MRNLRFVVAYDGTKYSGFQSQPDAVTIQGELETAIENLTREPIKIQASGRTDAGVHAKGQVFNFITTSQIPVERWCLALNTRLPLDIVTRNAEEVPLEFHSRHEAKLKTYSYTIRTGRFADVFNRQYQLHHPARLDVEAMRAGLMHLLGEHDFTSFCSVRSTKRSHVRKLYDLRLDVLEDDYDVGYNTPSVIRIVMTGNGFLYNMVRIIVGTLLQIGRGKRTSEDMARILAAKDRSKAGPTAEAHGLMLQNVHY
ncbi:tRNA pseudouridine(38-40) synthase TruA [Paenibacillus sp. N1-5-1-14]|uniref:tRNA pseudouridine(38-40) synthase TruA n=1 Tax=Paenibacillus radicibacter TaxID=2972488 RepID=UPI0021592305|nr:tRNA pseudouridine(38-40) synthase TruA [Paenibacillus radicibacter]MCR8645765.1 tRNA pseudouridine(38-40) synthase TruA [Paenibacillus radicibacter]